MALEMEERTTTEILGRNNAIEKLKGVVEALEAEKQELSAQVTEIGDLRSEVVSLRSDKESAALEVSRLRKLVEDAQTSETLAIEHSKKANEICENLRSEIDAKKQLSAALQRQVLELEKQMESLCGLALVKAETYKAAVEKFG